MVIFFHELGIQTWDPNKGSFFPWTGDPTLGEKHGRDFENGKYLGEEELREKANYKDKSERKQMKSQLG